MRFGRLATKGRNRRVLVSTFLAAMVVASYAHVALPGASADPAVPNFDHIFVIIMENKPAAAVNPAATPYITSLAASGATLTQSYAVTHPSLPNYLALTGGSTFGVTTDCETCYLGTAPNIASDRIEPSGRTWKAYMESMPAPCGLSSTASYAVKHNPFVYYDNIRTNPTECGNDAPYSQLATDLSSTATTPSFGWITPNLCNDAHDCSITTGDTWLSNNVPALLSSPAFTTQRSLLVLTFDEDDQSDGNHIPTILVGSGITPGTQSNVPYTHYSVLKTIETAWSLPSLTSNDEAAQPIADIFSTSTTTEPTSSAPTTTTVSATITPRGPASSAAWTSDSTTNLTLPVPAGAQAGDVLVASLGFGKSAATTQPTLTPPAGWTLVRRTNMGTIAAMAVYTHVFTPGETTFTWTTNVTVGAAVFMAAFGGVNTATPVDVSAGQSVASGAGTSIAAPSVATIVAGDMLVASYYGWRNGGNRTTWTAPAGMTELGDATTTTSRSGSLDSAIQVATGASGTKVATASAAQDHVVTALTALRPATVTTTTSAPTTSAPTTSAPTTSAPTTSDPTTSAPTTSAPTTTAPTTTTTVPASIAARGPASSAAWTSDSTTNLTLPVPAGAQAGDVLVASLGFGKSAATTQPTLTAPAGWTLVRRTNMGSIAALAVYTHVLAAGQTTFTWTTNVTVGAAVFMAAYSGVNAATPVEVSAGASVASAAGKSIVAPSVTTTTAGDMLVASYYGWRNGGTGTTWLAPAGMTELGDATTTTSRSGSLDGALQPVAGASGTKIATASAAQDHVVTTLIALKPA